MKLIFSKPQVLLPNFKAFLRFKSQVSKHVYLISHSSSSSFHEGCFCYMSNNLVQSVRQRLAAAKVLSTEGKITSLILLSLRYLVLHKCIVKKQCWQSPLPSDAVKTGLITHVHCKESYGYFSWHMPFCHEKRN